MRSSDASFREGGSIFERALHEDFALAHHFSAAGEDALELEVLGEEAGVGAGAVSMTPWPLMPSAPATFEVVNVRACSIGMLKSRMRRTVSLRLPSTPPTPRPTISPLSLKRGTEPWPSVESVMCVGSTPAAIASTTAWAGWSKQQEAPS